MRMTIVDHSILFPKVITQPVGNIFVAEATTFAMGDDLKKETEQNASHQ